LGLSPRYTRMVFSAEGESVSDYIMRRRLEECAHQLTSAPWNSRSITETAFDWGFSSMAHFARSFKEKFAATPTEYRRGRSIS
jgi:AraC-like DNA-binding protein